MGIVIQTNSKKKKIEMVQKRVHTNSPKRYVITPSHSSQSGSNGPDITPKTRQSISEQSDAATPGSGIDKIISVKQWLLIFGMDQYFDDFVKNGYDSLDIIKEITDKSELEDIGIVSNDHQTKIMTQIAFLGDKDLEEMGGDFTQRLGS